VPALTPANELVRSRNVSASEVGALLPGGHPYTTPEAIYDRLTGAAPERKGSEAMALGSFFEASILRFAEQRDGFRARLNSRTIEHRDVRLCATVDAFVIGSMPWATAPERALVEVKMSGRIELWREVPAYIEAQVRAQLACSGRDVAYIYVLVSQRLLRFPIYRDAAMEEQLIAAVQRFWSDHIVAGVRPGPTASASPTFSFETDRAIPEKEMTTE